MYSLLLGRHYTDDEMREVEVMRRKRRAKALELAWPIVEDAKRAEKPAKAKERERSGTVSVLGRVVSRDGVREIQERETRRGRKATAPEIREPTAEHVHLHIERDAQDFVTRIVGDDGTTLDVERADTQTERRKLEGLMADRSSAYWRGPDAERLQARYRELAGQGMNRAEDRDLPSPISRAVYRQNGEVVAAVEDMQRDGRGLLVGFTVIEVNAQPKRREVDPARRRELSLLTA